MLVSHVTSALSIAHQVELGVIPKDDDIVVKWDYAEMQLSLPSPKTVLIHHLEYKRALQWNNVALRRGKRKWISPAIVGDYDQIEVQQVGLV